MTARRASLLCAAAVASASLAFYLRTLAPGLTWAHHSADGGELAAAAKTLGIPHPPGYPTYVLLAHLFTYLPIGEVATRTNLLSASSAAVAAALTTWTLERVTNSWAAAVTAGLALALSPLLWFQAVVTEVHALNALFTALLLGLTVEVGLAQRLTSTRAGLLGLALGGAWGLSLGNHLTALFCAPLVTLALWRLRRFGVLTMIGVALGLLVYLYLPLRAAADPPVNWGDPRTPARFWWMVTGGPYHQFAFSLPRAHLPERALAWSGLLTRQFGWIGLVPLALGAAALSSRDGPLFGMTAATVVLCSAFAIGYDTTDSYTYLIPPLICAAVWLGVGVDWLLGVLTDWVPQAAGGIAALVTLLPLLAGLFRMPTVDLSGDRVAKEFEAAVLTPAPSDAVILSQGDASTFALWYFQHGVGRRPDVTIVDTELLGYDWYVAQLSQRLQVPPPTAALRAGTLGALRRGAARLERPVCRIDAEPEGLSCVSPP